MKQAVSDKEDSGTTHYQEDDEVAPHLETDCSYVERLHVAPNGCQAQERQK